MLVQNNKHCFVVIKVYSFPFLFASSIFHWLQKPADSEKFRLYQKVISRDTFAKYKYSHMILLFYLQECVRMYKNPQNFIILCKHWHVIYS